MLEFLFGPRNPTSGWPARRVGSLVLRLDEGSLNGVLCGGPLEEFAFLGPDEDRTAYRTGDLTYYSLGLMLFCDDSNRITEITAVSFDPDEPRFQSFAGELIVGGQQVELAGMNEQRFLDRFGACYRVDRDEDYNETILFYEFANLEWQVEFDFGSRLKCIAVCCEPLLADAETRRDYQVTKPWLPSI